MTVYSFFIQLFHPNIPNQNVFRIIFLTSVTDSIKQWTLRKCSILYQTEADIGNNSQKSLRASFSWETCCHNTFWWIDGWTVTGWLELDKSKILCFQHQTEKNVLYLNEENIYTGPNNIAQFVCVHFQ